MRSYRYTIVSDAANGNRIVDAQVEIRELGTTTLATGVYIAETGGDPLDPPRLLSKESGIVEYWLDDPRDVTLHISNTGAAHYHGSTGILPSFSYLITSRSDRAAGAIFVPVGTLNETNVQDALTQENAQRTAADATLTSDVAAKIPLAQKGAANGVAPLGADSKVPAANLPDAPADAVTSVNTQTGAVVLDAGDVGAADAASTETGMAELLGLHHQERLQRRRLGHMNIGVAGITLRHDDGDAADYTKTFPIERDRGIIGTFALVASYLNDPGKLTTAQIVEMLQYGNAMATHSDTHANYAAGAWTEADLQSEVVAPRETIEALHALIRAELWVTPGTFNMFLNDSEWAERHGTLVQSNYVAATGFSYDTFHWPNQEIYGSAPYAIDAETVAAVKARIDQAVANRDVLHLSLHSWRLDTAGYMTTAQYTEVCDYIKSYMDAGMLESLTVPGGLFAQPHGEWEDLIREGDFENLPYANATWGPWSATAAPVLKTDGGADGTDNYVQCSSTNRISQSRYNVADSDVEKAHYRFRCKVRNSTGTGSAYSVLLQDSTDPGRWLVSLSGAAATSWSTLERCVTVPAGLDRVSVVLQSSGAGFIDYDQVEMRRL